MDFSVLISCIFASTLISGAESGCPESFEHHGTRCYKLLALEASWAEARTYCKTFGGELAVIEDQAEDNLVMGLISRLHGAVQDEIYWVAGSDAMSENDWRWYPTEGVSIPIKYFRWGPGQPDNAGRVEHCLELNYHGAFNDRNCNYLRSFICEAAYTGGEQIIG